MIVQKGVLTLFFVVLLLPIWFMGVGSFQNVFGVVQMPPQWIPLRPTIDNYAAAFTADVPRWALNSLIVVAMTTTLSILVCSAAGYVFAFYRFKGKKILWPMMLLGLMVPRISLLIPLYIVIHKLGISGTLIAVILPIVLSPQALFLARMYFQTVPQEIMESARLDGASEVGVLIRIVMPLSKPILTAIGLFVAMGALGDFIWQMLVLHRTERQTLLIGLMQQVMTRGGADANINPLGREMAVGIILLIPLLAVFVVANRYFTHALGGAVRE